MHKYILISYIHAVLSCGTEIELRPTCPYRFPQSGSVKQGRGGWNQQFSIFKREYLENGSRCG